ncbi:MAG: pilus assembly protein PilM [Ruminococcus sp.]|nr:pilus assembly protein PilM [Ruminococcus sp.]
MLSFDITDRNIRVVKGVESNGKIKISSAATLNVEEGLIENGHVKDVPNVATLINGILKRNKMPDKEAIVSISSNLTIFKELTVVKEKNQDMSKTVKQQVQAELNLDDSYCVTYIIVGEAEEKSEGGNPIYKVLATACPFEIVNSYREVFKLLGISLRSVMVGCNCITKVLLADTKIKSKMPLLAVQIDNNFISLNLYENGQLAFSRFASIDSEDYGGSEDYVFEAVNENIFRMLQFHRSRNTGEVIENVIFYGDTHEYVRLTDELEKLDLKTSLINVPPQIHGHENLEFSLYANAIGAMFKRNREVEKINLLETELGTVIKNKVRGDNAGYGLMLGLIVGAAVIVGGIWGIMALKDNSINNDIQEIQDFIDSPDTAKKLKHRDKLIEMKEKVTDYNTRILNAYDAYNSMPVVTGDKYDTLQEVLDKTAEDFDIKDPEILTPSYANGVFTFMVRYEAKDDKDIMIEELPAQFITNLTDSSFKENKGYYRNSAYTGYSVNYETETTGGSDDEPGTSEEKKMVSFNVTTAINGEKSAYHEETSTDDTAEEEAAE